MTACFHLPSVICENCAHLERGSAKSPWVGVVSSGTTITLSAGNGLVMPSEPLSLQSFLDEIQRLTQERDEALAILRKREPTQEETKEQQT